MCGHKNAFPHSARANGISGWGYSALLVPVEGQTTLISPLGYAPNLTTGVDRAKTSVNFGEDLVQAINESHVAKIRIALAGSDIIPVVYLDELRRNFPEMTVVFADSFLARRRMIKSESEVKILRFAAHVADKAVDAAVESIKPGMTESAIGTMARRIAMELGADYVVRDRVQSGSEIGRARWPFASQRRIRRGELVSIDFVGWVGGYGFDILRLGCAGRPNKEQRALIETAMEATNSLIETLRDGRSVESAILRLAGMRQDGITVEPFGHGIGLEIVEVPYLLPEFKGSLKENMILCVEPTIRKLGASASIENEVLITRSKPEIVTKLPMELWE